MSEFPAQTEQNTTPERQVMILGPRLQPLAERIGHDDFSADIMINDRFDDTTYGDAHIVNEEELVTNYFDYLSQVVQVASNDDSEKGRDVLARATRFASETTYMSVADRQEAIRGLATSQADYLDAEPSRRLLFYGEPSTVEKSQGKLIEEAVTYLKTARPDLRDQIDVIGLHPDDEDEQAKITALDANKTKVVFLDDWSVTGSQLTNGLSRARGLLARFGREDLANDLEINLLLARSDQVQNNFSAVGRFENDNTIDRPVPIRAYYISNAIRNPYAGPTPTGAHSTVDYGFGEELLQMHKYLKQKTLQSDVLMPQMASIKQVV